MHFNGTEAKLKFTNHITCNRLSITLFHPTKTYINSLLVTEAFSDRELDVLKLKTRVKGN